MSSPGWREKGTQVDLGHHMTKTSTDQAGAESVSAVWGGWAPDPLLMLYTSPSLQDLPPPLGTTRLSREVGAVCIAPPRHLFCR